MVTLADHTDRATPKQLANSDVVAITHEAYTRAKETLSGVNADRWHRLTNWRGGRRLLTIVDEALANVVKHSQVKLDELSRVIGHITHELTYLDRNRRSTFLRLLPTFLTAFFTAEADLRVFFASYRTS